MALKRTATWLVFAGTAAIAAVAVADALRPHEDVRPQARAAGRPGTAELLRRAGIRGGILTLAGPDCSTRQVAMPSFSSIIASRPPIACGGRVWDPTRTVAARCRDRRVTLLGFGGESPEWRGCAPAWRPSGFLTFVRDGAVVEAEPLDCVRRCTHTLLSRADLARELAGRVPDADSYGVAELAWMSSSRFAAVLRGRKPWQEAIAVFTPPRLLVLRPAFGQRLSGLRASPRGHVAALRSELGRDAVLFAADGRELPLPRIANVRAIAFSPSTRWIALATRTAIFIARTGEVDVIARLPIAVRALTWE